MPEQLQLFDQPKAGSGFVICCVPATGMFLLLLVASCTSCRDFDAIYMEVTRFLLLNKTHLSSWLLSSPNFGHVWGYALLSIFLSGVFARRRLRLFIAPLVAASFGLTMEGVQLFIPTRGASLTDMGFNLLGIAIGFGVYGLWLATRQTFQRQHRF